MLAGILSALCVWFSWRAYRRGRDISASGSLAELEPLERNLEERERNVALNQARRSVQTLGRVAIFGGAALAFWGFASGDMQKHPISLWTSLACGLVGWAGCRELRRRIGSLADSWRQAVNRERRRQGVDQASRTG